LLATAPNQLWSWDITKLRGPVKWTYFYLYVIIDVFSRYVTGWMIAYREGAELAKQFIEEAIGKHQVPAGQLTIHADRGRVMRSKPVAFLMADLGVTKSHSRPYVSDDNPYSESQFRTMKYRPEFPDRFGCIQDSRAFCQQFFQWYNEEHRHSGIALLTPAVVHFGETQTVLAHRQVVLDTAYQAHPDRFVRRPPKPMLLPSEVWINKPVPSGDKTAKLLPLSSDRTCRHSKYIAAKFQTASFKSLYRKRSGGSCARISRLISPERCRYSSKTSPPTGSPPACRPLARGL
jgi:putative transposase